MAQLLPTPVDGSNVITLVMAITSLVETVRRDRRRSVRDAIPCFTPHSLNPLYS